MVCCLWRRQENEKERKVSYVDDTSINSGSDNVSQTSPEISKNKIVNGRKWNKMRAVPMRMRTE